MSASVYFGLTGAADPVVTVLPMLLVWFGVLTAVHRVCSWTGPSAWPASPERPADLVPATRPYPRRQTDSARTESRFLPRSASADSGRSP